MIHRGIRCALPSESVERVERARETGEDILRLWDGHPESIRGEEWLAQIQIGDGFGWLPASDITVRELHESSLFALPGLVRSAAGLPFVVGLGELDDEVYWLINPQLCRIRELGSENMGA